jgi:lipid II:glycine glycyltransferase (peptidoglycan interpeptide bridge formation enzyme)
LDEQIKKLRLEIEELEQLIPKTEQKISEEKEKVEPLEEDVLKVLENIKEKIIQENLDLSDIYKLIMSIFVDNIITVMEYISYME